jgi:hypothetical protein
MAAAARPIYVAQAGTDCSIASLLISCPIERDVASAAPIPSQ